MSNVSSFHSINSYSGKESALSGQRLVTVTFKTDKETGIKPESKCVSVPLVADSFGQEILDNWNLVEKHIHGFFADVQDKIIREAVTEGKTQVHENEIGLFSCLDFLSSVSSGGRLSKEILSNWFSEEVEPVLATVLCEKLGVQNSAPDSRQEKIITQTLKRFEQWIISLSGTKTLFGNDTILQLEKCFSLVSSSPLLDKLTGKLEEMKKQNSLLSEGLAL